MLIYDISDDRIFEAYNLGWFHASRALDILEKRNYTLHYIWSNFEEC